MMLYTRLTAIFAALVIPLAGASTSCGDRPAPPGDDERTYQIVARRELRPDAQADKRAREGAATSEAAVQKAEDAYEKAKRALATERASKKRTERKLQELKEAQDKARDALDAATKNRGEQKRLAREHGYGRTEYYAWDGFARKWEMFTVEDDAPDALADVKLGEYVMLKPPKPVKLLRPGNEVGGTLPGKKPAGKDKANDSGNRGEHPRVVVCPTGFPIPEFDSAPWWVVEIPGANVNATVKEADSEENSLLTVELKWRTSGRLATFAQVSADITVRDQDQLKGTAIVDGGTSPFRFAAALHWGIVEREREGQPQDRHDTAYVDTNRRYSAKCDVTVRSAFAWALIDCESEARVCPGVEVASWLIPAGVTVETWRRPPKKH